MRTRDQVAAEISLERQAFLDADLAGDKQHADEHYARMDKLVEEYAHVPHQRPALPSDSDGHAAPQVH